MSAAKHDEELSVRRAESTLTQETEMAKLRSSNSRLWKIVFGTLVLLFLSWLSNTGLMVAVVLAKEQALKVEDGSLKNMDGAAVSTHGQKNVYEITLVSSRRALGEQGSNGTHEQHALPVAQVACANVLLAISSIENGDDESLVKMSVGDGEFWEPRMSAASYHLHENSFGIEQIYLDDQRDVSYDVTCELSKADCKSAPDSVCDAVSSGAIFQDEDRRALSFEDAFDGDSEAKVHPRRLEFCKSDSDAGTAHWHTPSAPGHPAVSRPYQHKCPLPKCVLCTCSSNTGGWHGTYSNCATHTARSGHRGYGPFTCLAAIVSGDLTFRGHGTCP